MISGSIRVAEFRGRLYIFVDAICVDERAAPALGPGDAFGTRAPGTLLWYMNGWAVGQSARGSYCARTSLTKLRSFATFAAAMDYVHAKRKTRQGEQFHLVYEVDGSRSVVTSLAHIQRLDGSVVGSGAGAGDPEHPELAALSAKVGQIVASNALLLLRILTREGSAAARARFSAATFERLWRVLEEAALVEGSAPDAYRVPPALPDGGAPRVSGLLSQLAAEMHS